MIENAQGSDFFLSITEAAKLLKVSVPTLYGWIHQRRIPYRKHGRRVVFHREDLDAWSESQRVLPIGGISSPLGLKSKGYGHFSKVPRSLKTRRTAELISNSFSKKGA